MPLLTDDGVNGQSAPVFGPPHLVLVLAFPYLQPVSNPSLIRKMEWEVNVQGWGETKATFKRLATNMGGSFWAFLFSC